MTFVSDGSTFDTIQVAENSPVFRPDDPTKEGHNFLYWYAGNDNSAYDFASPVTGALTLTAKFTRNVYNVTLDPDNGGESAVQQVEHGSPATRPADPEKEHYTFEGWYIGEVEYQFTEPVTGELTLKAKWNPAVYTLTYDLSGGVFTGDAEDLTESCEYGEAVYLKETWQFSGLNAPEGMIFDCLYRRG